MAKPEPEKHPGGRPSKLTTELIQKAEKYLADNEALGPAASLPTVERLCLILDIDTDTFYEWKAKKRQFSGIARRLKLTSSDKLQQNSLAGRWNPSISKLLLSQHGYVEKTEQNLNHSGAVQFVNDVPRPKA